MTAGTRSGPGLDGGAGDAGSGSRAFAWPLVLGLAAVKLVLHLLTASGYGYFRDELYFLACAQHLDWGYVDQPPLVAVIAWFARNALGESLFAIRLLPALAGAGKIVLTGMIAWRLGGGRAAQAIACLAVLAGPVYLAVDSMLSVNPFEPLFWIGCVYLLIRIIQTNNQRLWLIFGLLAGLGLQNKHSMLFFGFALVAGLLLTSQRRQLVGRWFWLGGIIAAGVFLPNLTWEAQHDWATIELLRNVQVTGKNVVVSPPAFIANQAFMLNPFTAPLWLAGLLVLLIGRRGRPFRALGWAYLVLLATMIALAAKDYYVAPIYPLLMAAGAVAIEPFLRRWPVLAVVTGALVVSGSMSALLALPVLPPDRYIALSQRLGITPTRTEVSHAAAMPQHLSDRFGWPEMVAQIAEAYRALPQEQRAETAIYGSNYGEAGAIDFYGPAYGLPRAISPHQNYYRWGPRGYTGESIIVIGNTREELEGYCESLRQVAETSHPYAEPEENGPIFHCMHMRPPLPELWPQIKTYR